MANAVPAPRLSKEDRQWRAQDDIRTLTQADAIRADKQRMSDVTTHAKRQADALHRVAGVKPAAAAKKAAPRGKR